ncbi:hypothetical protein [Thermomonospora umbrina]|uniref:hypothetical protein n=1 Tax=Thermomonospora umbrina TaxID=111806 RepID=UPI000E266FD3|nr:hypothetical protein [Thermomonospora umbrina]
MTVDDGDPEAVERVRYVVRRPSSMDERAVGALAEVLAGQRRLEDVVGSGGMLAPVTAQFPILLEMLRDVPGRHHRRVAGVASEWATFAGWLHAATRRDGAALKLFQQAEALADEAEDGTLAATATSFRGYVARTQGRPRAVVRWSAAALATPGSHPTQRVFDMIQTAQGHAALGDVEAMRRFLDDAAALAAVAGEPPPSVYWYREPFFHVQIGLAHLQAGNHRDAAEMIEAGLHGMPAEQRAAEWAREYEDALAVARDRA